ncbi:FAD NAD(P)-binding domain-containing protein [Fusarium heterosporum]|uniref:FAD NAD(P)-binding domain-containing protein n=1 Tax=Fusarium heterosporum TaxID=42747 RepID=A0A8H5U5B2_FUSHE|nr:FAD NAD(P)-binding domain-containing protein [Fusarium heterosporum]
MSSFPTMALKTELLSLGNSYSFDKILEAGSFILFYSATYNLLPDKSVEIDNTSINVLSSEDDVLLHISFRRAENQIVFNSRLRNYGWGKEERVSFQGVLSKTDATVAVRLETNSYTIYIDDSIIHTYSKRILKDAQRISYQTARESLFTNPIGVVFQTKEQAADDEYKKKPATSYQDAYFPLTPEGMAKESEAEPFDYVIVGSGIGGGILATDLLDKNHLMSRVSASFSAQATKVARSTWSLGAPPVSTDDKKDRTKRILVIERGNLLFPTHSLNMPRPTNRGTYGQMNDLFYNHFKQDWEMDDKTRKIWKGGPVYCLGGRSTVWGLFSPRTYFPKEVYQDLKKTYLRKAEEWMNISYPRTLSLHRALKDSLNLRPPNSPLPTTQWEWGRVASEFGDPRNFDFAEGAFSTVDRLLEAAMDDHCGLGKFKIIINSLASRLEPMPAPGKVQSATHVVVKDTKGVEHKIRTKNTVLCAGAIESPSILLRSMGGEKPKDTFGKGFSHNFGHVTDHYIFYVTLPFYYKDMKMRDLLGGVKLQTDITFHNIDNSTALANISLDASSFLPRRDIPDSELPQFIIAYILPSQLAPDNEIKLDEQGRTRIKVRYAEDHKLEQKKTLLKDFAVDAMNKIASSLDIQFVKHKFDMDDYVILPEVTVDQIELGELGPGGVAHELGSIPMPNAFNKNGILDANLKMQYGWDNVYVCDLSVFPYSPAANPTLSLAALSLRLSDHLVPPSITRYQPIVVHNLCSDTVYVSMTRSNEASLFWDPPSSKDNRAEIKSGQSLTWKREQKESIFVYSSQNGKDFDVQIVQPGIAALITESPSRMSGTSLKAIQ